MKGILTGKGINAQRKLFAGQTNFDAEVSDLVTTASPKFLYRAIVVDVLYDPDLVLDEAFEKYGELLAEPGLLRTAPRNSIIARMVSDGADKRNRTLTLFYPLFSHTHEPIKPGEKVWVAFEEAESSRDIGYWLTRIVTRRDVDDPNFTHADRAFIDQQSPSTVDRFDLSRSRQSPGPSFPNGSDTREGYTLTEPDAYETIDKSAIANRVVTREPVPRFKKRPGDWVAEGSNNSLFVLGEDRTGPTSKTRDGDVSGKPDDDKPALSGMFDLVVGRGMGRERKLPQADARPELTAPPVVKNVRDRLETDKDPSRANPQEGDPDFEFDLTRIYGAMDTDIDGNFGKPLPKLPGNKDVAVVDSGAGLIVKSTHVRVIAREDGSIRIVKEGQEDDEGGKGRAVIIIESDGTVMIDGPRIVIGSGIEKGNGAGTQLQLGRDATEPIVLGNTLKQVMTEYSSKVQQAFDTLGQMITTFTTLGNFGIAIPDLVKLQASYPALQQSLDQATSKFQQDLTKALSKNGKTR